MAGATGLEHGSSAESSLPANGVPTVNLSKDRRPYWGQAILRKYVRAVALNRRIATFLLTVTLPGASESEGTGKEVNKITTLQTSRMAGMSNEALQSDSTATPFSAFISAVVSGNLPAAEALFADDIEWGLTSTGQKLKGKAEVMPWLRAGAASRKEPVTISDPAATGTSCRIWLPIEM
jgi:hypothetical protein